MEEGRKKGEGTYDDEDTEAGSGKDTNEIVIIGNDLLAERVGELGFDSVDLKEAFMFVLDFLR